MLAIQVLQQILWQMGTLVVTPAFWFMVGIVYLQIRRRAKTKEEMFQTQHTPVIGPVAVAVAAGMTGGVFCSILLLLLGVSVTEIGLAQMWVLALLLILIRQRFFCFAYAGGLISISHCMVHWPSVQVEQVLGLIAVLHFTEAFLVLFTGYRGALPLYLRDRSGNMAGGFLMQMTWPLPMLMLFPVDVSAAPIQTAFFLFPDWWPVLNHGVTSNMIFMLVPVFVAIGYSDIAVCHNITQRVKQSAGLLFLYSGILLLLVVLTAGRGLWQLIPALFAPLGHEAMIQYGKQTEQCCHGYYQAPKKGISILDVQPGSPAAMAGLRREDRIYYLNGQPVENRQQFMEQQFLFSAEVLVEYVRKNKRKHCRMQMKTGSQPGILIAPDENCCMYWEIGKDEGLLKLLYKKFEKTLKKVE